MLLFTYLKYYHGKMTLKQFRQIFSVFLFFLFFTACFHKAQPAKVTPNNEETAILLNFLEENGDQVNGPNLPSLISADNLFQLLDDPDFLIIDLRPKPEYASGFIPNAVNVSPSDILDYFENQIEPETFERIVLTCPNGSLSGYVNGVLLLLGYDNVSTLRFGLSSWNMDIARQYWLSGISDTLEGKLETNPSPQKTTGTLPFIATGEKNGHDILKQRAREILNVTLKDVEMDLNKVLENPEKWHLVGYWPENMFNQGHIKGSFHYEPKISLHSQQEIATLPVDKPIVLYCYSGHHTAFVAPFLRLLGYEAYNLSYGSNGFIHSTMSEDPSPTRSFSEASVRNYPVYYLREKIY
jgi:rhodanese-related sulfurtransferase